MEAFTAQCQDPGSHQLAVLVRLLDLHRGVDVLHRHGVEVPATLCSTATTTAAATGAPAAGPPAGAGAPSAEPAAAEVAAQHGPAALGLLRRLPLTSYSDYEQQIEEAVEAGRAFTPDDTAAQVRGRPSVGAPAACRAPLPAALLCRGHTEICTRSLLTTTHRDHRHPPSLIFASHRHPRSGGTRPSRACRAPSRSTPFGAPLAPRARRSACRRRCWRCSPT